MPLLSSSVSNVPKYSVDNYIDEYESQIVCITGTRPKSMLWLILHDLRFLFLRMSYGESITQDCGGGSLTSNSLLIFYMLLLADNYKGNEVDVYSHASALSSALILGWKIIQSKDHGMDSYLLSRLKLNMAEATPMAALCCILFHSSRMENSDGSISVTSTDQSVWNIHREVFCSSLMYLSGYRHALGIEGSGCESSRNPNSGRRARSTSFHDWDGSPDSKCEKTTESSIMTKLKSFMGKRSSCPLEQYAKALRPMITLFIVFDHLAKDFAVGMNDDVIDQSSVTLAGMFESCQRAENLGALLRIGNLPIDKGRILDAFNEGCRAATTRL